MTPPTRTCDVRKFREDYQVLLATLFDDATYGEPAPVPASLVADWVSLDEHRSYLIEELDAWRESDLKIVNGMLDLIVHGRENELPPLVLNRGALVDGYHRLCALVIVGQSHWWAFDIQKLLKEQALANPIVQHD